MGERWFERTRFPSDEWFRIAVPSHFESSGLPGAANYDGQVWYALSFDTPKGWGGKAVRLRFEAVDDEAEVWLNGKRLGLHTKEGDADTTWWEEPFSFDATAALKPEGANTLVVRVDDFTASTAASGSLCCCTSATAPAFTAESDGRRNRDRRYST